MTPFGRAVVRERARLAIEKPAGEREAHTSLSLDQAFALLIEDRRLVERLAAGVPAVKRIEDDARDWDARYERVLSTSSSSAATRP